MALPGSGGGSGWESRIAPHAGLLVLRQYVTGLKVRYGDRIEVVGVLVRDSLENALVWLEREGTTYPILQERHGRLAKEFWISGLPRLVLLTPDRRLEWDFLGAASGVNAWSTDSVDVHFGSVAGWREVIDCVQGAQTLNIEFSPPTSVTSAADKRRTQRQARGGAPYRRHRWDQRGQMGGQRDLEARRGDDVLRDGGNR